jgi:FSR family fosmidomycin resistance protein-like MFS transporter
MTQRFNKEDRRVMERIKRRVLSTVVLHHLCNDASVVALPAIFPILYREGLLIRRYSDIGTTILIGLGVAVLFQLIIGHNVKRRHYRCCLALDALTVGISLLLMTLSHNYFMLVIFFVGVRIGTSVYHPVGISWISGTFTGRNLDRAMGIQSAFGDIGVLAAFISTGFLAQYFGWRIPLLLWGIINLAAVGVGLSISRGTSEPARAQTDEGRVSWLETIGRLRAFMPVIILGGMAWGVTLGYAPSLFNHKFGISMSGTGIILSCWMAAGTVSSFLYGKISDLLGRHLTITIAYIIIVITTLTLGLSGSTYLTITAFILYGVALFVTYPAILSFVGSTIDGRNRTAAFSLVATIQILGNSAFAFISGFLSDAYGINTPFLLLCGATLLSVAYITFVLRLKHITAGPAPARSRPKDIVSG